MLFPAGVEIQASGPFAVALSAVLVLCLIITIWLVSKRIGTEQYLRLFGVCLLNLLATLSLLGWILGINVLRDQIQSVNLITKGADLELTKNGIHSNADSFVFGPGDIPAKHLPDLHHINTLDQLQQEVPGAQQLNVFGDGLNEEQWQEVERVYGQDNPLAINFVPSKRHFGLINMRWTKQLVQGQFQQISGRLQHHQGASDTLYTLSLLDPSGQVVVEQNLRPEQHFTLSFAPKALGFWLYQITLSEASSPDVIVSEQIAMEVQNRGMPRLLVKQSAPSFETRHLKNWASRFGAKLTVMTQISQDKHISQHVNLVNEKLPKDYDPFTSEDLERYDLVIMDGRALTTMASEQVGKLQTAISKGLGLLILADPSLMTYFQSNEAGWLAPISLQESDFGKPGNSAIPHWNNSKVEQAIPIVNLSLFSPQHNILAKSEEGRILIANNNRGLGSVAVSLIKHSYQWQIEGQQSTYSHYWQYLLAELSRNRLQNRWLKEAPDKIVVAGQSIRRCFIAKEDHRLTKFSNQLTLDYTLIPYDDGIVAHQSCVRVWPQTTGWKRLDFGTEGNGSENSQIMTQGQYVYAKGNWQAWQQKLAHQATEKRARRQLEAQPKMTHQPIPSIWFWATLTFSLSLLWIERKLYQSV